jgi:phosphohistidine phosphatase SixA
MRGTSRWWAVGPGRLALAALLAGVAGGAPASGSSPPEPAGVVYLARHAETEGEGPARGLSVAGQERAAALAARLGEAGVTAIFTTDYPRTRATAAPIAARLGLEPRVYDPDDLAGFARQLRAAGGVALVVGHSNTTHDLVRLLGGEAGPPIPEDEHDRLYRVELASGATELSRFDPLPSAAAPPPG